MNTGEAVVDLDPRRRDRARGGRHGEHRVAAPICCAGGTRARGRGDPPRHAPIDPYENVEPVIAKNKRDPFPTWLAVEPLTDFGRRPSETPFLGRGSELGLLDDVWQRVVTGRRAHLVTILGEPGIGKSRIAAELANHMERTGGRSLLVRELPYTQSVGYEAFGQLVKEVAGVFELDVDAVITEKLERSLAELGVDDPEVSQRLAVFVGTAEASAEDRREVFDVARRFVEALAHDQPTLLVFDDIHWAHPSMLDLIDSLAARMKDTPILFCASPDPSCSTSGRCGAAASSRRSRSASSRWGPRNRKPWRRSSRQRWLAKSRRRSRRPRAEPTVHRGAVVVGR